MAGDLHTLGNVLGATVEEQVVQTLNEIRMVWDPKTEYQLYSFVRQGQTFPDVLLRSGENESDVIMGIELKSWYLLAKEAVPTFRFAVNRQACNPQDLLMVVPWALSNVLSGRPVAFTPWVENAKWAAEYRNYWWQEVRKTSEGVSSDIKEPSNVKPYPKKSDKIEDKPFEDSGGNFGRIARTKIMDAYLQKSTELLICGITVKEWVSFFKKIRSNPRTVKSD